MRFAVTDTETTGLEGEVCELAVVLSNGSEISRWSSLIRPRVAVEPDARAVHHITDAELAQTWSMEEMLAGRGVPEYEDAVLVGHNLAFDWTALINSGFPADRLPARHVCTWRCAMHVWPNAPSHGNQTLRYWLGLTVPSVELPPHRALPDALVTHALLERLLRERTAEELEKLTRSPLLLRLVRFGKHRDMLWSDVPHDYLRWVLREDFDDDVHHTARYWLRGGRH